MEKKRLAKFLAAAGIAARRKCEDMIFEGKVKVNGSVALLPQTLVDENDKIECCGNIVKSAEDKHYYILNKPYGYTCTHVRKSRENLVLDLFSGINARLFTVGRLDRDTEGLILVTNDGNFANKVIHPSSNIKKEYVVKTQQEITGDHLKMISQGIVMENTRIKPVKVAKVRRGTLKVVVSEGKKREVRALVQAAGLDVMELKRIRIGGLKLGELAIGQWRPMTAREMEVIFE